HLAGHGQPTGGLNIAPAPIGERALREVFLFPFEAAVKLAHVGSVMASYNEIDGIPSHANKMLLTDILRDEWGFDGLLVSDYYAINELITRHGLAGSK
ncbi:MAG: glycoside hydrolase family 3 N-terminal domain-containing protein, partial [Paraglaciecola chathamensis]